MKLSTKIRILAIVLIILFCAVCAVFMPQGAEYIHSYVVKKSFDVPLWTIYLTGTILCVPCVVLLVLALRFSESVERDEIFTVATSRRLLLISRIFFADCALFLFVIVAMFCLGEMFVSPLFALIDLVGFGIGALLHILAGYIKRAAELKEEVDATL